MTNLEITLLVIVGIETGLLGLVVYFLKDFKVWR